jgi:DNA-binding PadR family transcriptional regulator
MYELIILSLLMRFPLHGYLIAQIANDTIGPWAKLSNGTLYPLLTKLEQSALIALAGDVNDTAQTERGVRRFTITDTGRKRFYQLMMDTASNIGDYQRVFHLKVPYLDLLQPRERLHLLNHYLNYCQACLLHIKTHAENLLHELGDDVPSHGLYRTLALQAMQERSRLWQAEVDWIGQLRDLLATEA